MEQKVLKMRIQSIIVGGLQFLVRLREEHGRQNGRKAGSQQQ